MSTILIIDDNQEYRTDLADILGFEKYQTLEAENGLAGLQMIQRFSPDLIICDVDMPILSGIEVLRTVKSDPVLAQIPFIVATGRADRLTAQTVLDLGADSYLTKPITITEFLVAIGHLLWEKQT